MSNETVTKSAGSGIGLFGVIAAVLAALKIGGVIAIGWGKIIMIALIPVWIVLGILAIMLIVAIIAGINS